MNSWQRFFDAHAPHYDGNPFTKHTQAEIDFFLTLYPLAPGARILDVGCGTGRHAVELARRGFRVTGLDLSEGMLAQARAKAQEAGVQVEFVQADAADFQFNEPFDAAICLCEGAVGLIERGVDAEAHDLAIFRNIARSLRPGAPFLLTALNGYAVIRQMNDERVHEGRFDPATMASNYEDEWDLPEGKRVMTIHERLFIAPEVTRMLREAGFQVDNVYGGTAGHWGRRHLSLDEVEAMYVCRFVGL
jgi:2-polyprenyl-3-methyl-5-hydroxy-6-metoxy-1,4-benzoquinol methylase